MESSISTAASDSALWRTVAETSAAALASGALQPISTTIRFIEDGGVRFIARVADNLERKRLDAVQRAAGSIRSCIRRRSTSSPSCRQSYLRLLAAVGNPRAYNLLATRDWMLVVPRARESWNSISVSALGFAGALLVRSESDLSELQRLGPMRLLREVTFNV